MLTENTTERIRAFIRFIYSDYVWFERVTGISASKWRDLDRGKTKAATVEMIDELCRWWPEFAFWFVTGKAASPRGQIDPTDYFDMPYGTVSSLDAGPIKLQRDSSGRLYPDRADLKIKDKMSKEYELSVTQGILHWSALLNHDDAISLAPIFWSEFVATLKNGQETTIELNQLKDWVNKFPIGYKEESDQ